MRFISSLKVYELAKELNFPAKKLILEIRKAGISVNGVFSILSPEEVELVRNISNTIRTKPHKNNDLNPLNSSAKEPEVFDEPKNTETGKSPDEVESKIDLQKIFKASQKNEEKIVDDGYVKIENKNGFGKYTYPNGSSYEGEWLNGKRNGYGTYKFYYGDKYEGEWLNGKENGQGTYIHSDGAIYKGEWKDGMEHGQGTYIYSDGGKYEGSWRNGERNGQGTYIYVDAAKHNIRQRLKVMLLGQGVLGKYVGEWLNGERNGQGTYTSQDGDKYEGEWLNGKENGQGTYTSQDGEKYEGKWKKGKYLGDENLNYQEGKLKKGKHLGDENLNYQEGEDLSLLYENIDDFFDYFDEVKDSVPELQKSKNVFTRTLKNANVYFDVIVFDLDETLIQTSSLEEFRGNKNLDNFSKIYENELKGALKKEFEILDESFLIELRKLSPQTKFFVFSNSPKNYANILLKNYYPRISWDGIIAFDDIEKHKPDPQGILTIQQLSKTEKIERIALIGDINSDVISGYQAGCFTILSSIAWSSEWRKKGSRFYKEHFQALNLIPDAIANSKDDIYEIISNPNEWLPPLENPSIIKEQSVLSKKRKLDTIKLYIPLGDKEKKRAFAFLDVDVLGKYFPENWGGKKYNFYAKHVLSMSSAEILRAKDTYQFPKSWIIIIAEYIHEKYNLSFSNFLSSYQGTIVTIIPSRSGTDEKMRRMEIMLENIKDCYEKKYNSNEEFPITFVPNLLKFEEGAQSNKNLNANARMMNIRDHLKLNNKLKIENKIVILIDDVVTTGYTLYFAKHFLMKQGDASKVQCMALTKSIS